MSAQPFFQSTADPTKLVNMDVDSLTTATTRTITMPDGNVRLIANGPTLPTSATQIGELFLLDGVGLHKALDTVGNWLEYTGDGSGDDTAPVFSLIGVADGASSLGTFTGTTIADNSTVKPALQSLETAVELVVSNLASTAPALGASLVGVRDAGGFYTATTVETVFAEIAPRLLTGTAPDWTVTNAALSRSIDGDDMTLQQVAKELCLLVSDLIARGVLS